MAKYLTGPSTKVWHLGGTPLPKRSSSAPPPALSPPRELTYLPLVTSQSAKTIECLLTEGECLREWNYRGSFRRRGPDTSTF